MRGKFDFLTVAKLTEAEVAHLKTVCPVWLDLTGKIYGNASGEWFAKKLGKYTYSVVSFAHLTTEGWSPVEGIACTLRGVREVMGTLAKEKAAKKAANWMWT